MTGIDFYLQSRDLAMPPRFLLMSGYGAADIARAGNVGREVQFLRKPWGVDELLRAVRAALDTEAPAA
jgi:FixJ family two-component response regulator